MIEIYAQIQGKSLIPVSQEYEEELKSYKQNQIVRCAISGTRKQRSVQQNKWCHAMFRIVAENNTDPEWDTPENVKTMVKRAMNFFDVFRVETKGNTSQVFFEFRSFAFDKMEQNEANVRYNDAKNICAKKLGVKPEVLEARAKEES